MTSTVRTATTPADCGTLVDLLRGRAAAERESGGYLFLADGDQEAGGLSWRELDGRARAIAVALRERAAPGSRVLLVYPSSLDFVAGLFGCFYAGMVAVPSPTPGRRGRDRFLAITRDARPAAVLAESSAPRAMRDLLGEEEGDDELPWILSDALETGAGRRWRDPECTPDSLAILQYTSGSTRSPRGVMVTHGNLMHNEEMIRAAFAQDESSVVVSWLPVHHDMGLMGTVLQPLYSGGRCVLMPPIAFLQRPKRWLSAISRYRGTTSGAPNFAYDLCCRRVGSEERRSLDLSSWRTAFNGSEPVRGETLDRFADTFAPCGFRRRAFQPCYGLAEATLLVTAARGGETGVRADAADLETGRFEPGDPGKPFRTVIGCGRSAGGQDVAIVDPESSRPLPEGEVGEIWVSGESVAAGYWERPEETAEAFGATLASGNGGGPYLRTGDLGFLHDGEVHVTGRRKDLVIVRGRNLYPQDVEWTVAGCHPLLRAGGGAAFSVDVGGEERLAVAHEVERRAVNRDSSPIVDAIRGAVADEHGVQAHAVILLRPGGLPRTTSGKVRRGACAEAFLADELPAVATSVLGSSESASERPSLDPADLAGLSRRERRDVLAGYLRSLVSHLLAVGPEEVPPERPLQALGIDSLAAMELRNAVESDLGVVIALSELVTSTTLSALADGLAEEGILAATASGRPATEERPELGELLPLSHGQRSLWFLQRLDPESAAYNVAFAARLEGEPDVDALRQSLTDLARRHDVLSSVIEAPAGEPRRRILPHPEIPFRIRSARGWEESRLREALAVAANRPFDLAAELPLRVELFEDGGGGPLALLVIHHVAVDLWSLVVMVDELRHLYAVRSRGEEPRLPAPAAGYQDFVTWQEALVDGSRGTELWERWRERLSDEPPALELPTDRPHGLLERSRGGSIPFSLDGACRSRLEALAAERGTTLYTVLLAAFVTFLHRYTGQRDILLGTPMAGRSRAPFEAVVGYFSNLVPLRVDVSDDPGFGDLVSRLREIVGEALELQDLPFPVLVERLGVPRDPSRHPLVQAVFAFEKPHRLGDEGIAGFALGEDGAGLALGDLRLRSVALERRSVPFDLTVVLAEAEERVRGSFQYRADLFEDSTARRMAEHLIGLVERAARRPESPLSELSLLGEAERVLVVEGWNDTAVPYPAERCIHELFEEQARSRPEAVAVTAGEVDLTYEELDSLADGLARRLRAAGVGPGSLVGVAMERSVSLPVALLAILKAGAGYLPLDLDYPERRLREIVADASVRVVVSEGSLRERVSPLAEELVLVDEGSAAAVDVGEPTDTGPMAPTGLAYVMYTSGSTGTPKGVMVPHRAVVRLVKGGAYARLGPGEVVLHAAPLAFDASTFEIWGPLLNGGRLVLYQGRPASLAELGAAIAEHGVTTLWLTAGLFHLMVDERLDDLRPLRQLLAGGDVLESSRVARILESLEGVRLVNGYGPTEATTFTCCHDVTAVPASGERVPVGRPIANTRVYVLDPSMKPVPPGVPGELFIGGDGLARGYLGHPGLTAERFVPDPFATEPGGRLYRTGDRVRWRPDGAVDFLGRLDRQVKVRGFRVEPGEVEAALGSHPAVAAAVVEPRSDPMGGRRLVAYFVSEDPRRPPAVPELLDHLSARLPAHMMPASFVAMEELPLTANGKVDRRALPPPPEPGAARGHAPADGLEGEIASVWAEVLGVASVDVERNLFDMGAHSLAMAKAQSRLGARLGREIPVVALFAHPTIGALAAHLRGDAGDDGGAGEGRRRASARRAARRARRGERISGPITERRSDDAMDSGRRATDE